MKMLIFFLLGSISAFAEVSYLWSDKSQTSCGAYRDQNFIGQVESSKCSYLYLNGEGKIRGMLNDQIILPEIFDLNPKGEISSADFKDYNSKDIARTLIQKIHRERENDRNISKPDYDFLKDTRIAIQFNLGNLDSILRKGFLNQYETKASNGSYDPSKRRWLENSFLGMDLKAEERLDHFRPKYAYVLLDKYRKKMGPVRLIGEYGDVVAVLKQSVKYRSTFTVGDSLDIKADSRDVRTFYFKSKKVLELEASLYFEAQIWGTLDFRDVYYLLVGCFDPVVDSSVVNALKATGKPVYQCSTFIKKGLINNVFRNKQL